MLFKLEFARVCVKVVGMVSPGVFDMRVSVSIEGTGSIIGGRLFLCFIILYFY